ncbi:MAG TPA: DUF1634 domain-containing protein [Terriglobales bacterium]|nr:DUF1634 domain-containing protein [Terriglobales bacterium]
MKHSEHLVAITLKYGAYLSFALLLAAVVLGVLGLQQFAGYAATAGILVLLATPMLRIIAALVMYAGLKDRKMVLVSAALLVIVVTASVLGVKMH